MSMFYVYHFLHHFLNSIFISLFYGSSDCMFLCFLIIYSSYSEKPNIFFTKKLCTRSRRTLFHCSWQYLLNTCLHSNKLMTGYITETFSFCASSLHWVHQPTAFYPILLQKWLLGKIQGYIQLKYVQKKKWI